MHHSIRLRHLLWILPLAVAVIAVACGGSGVKSPTASTSLGASSSSTPGSGAQPGAGGSGTLSVMIKDSPFNDATALLVTFSDLSAHVSGDGVSDGEWVEVGFTGAAESLTCDLKRLETAQNVLGVASLPEGHYTQLRLTVASAKIYFTEATSGDICSPTLMIPPATEAGIAVDIPSGTLKLNREFTVPEGGATEILLDFDGDKSVHQTGNGKYKMTPVIGIVSVK